MAQDLVDPKKLLDNAAQMSEKTRMASGGSWLSTASGVLKYQSQELLGNQLACVIIDFVAENTYYAGRYQPNDAAPPTCYAQGRDTSNMFPDVANMSRDMAHFVPQNIVNGEVLGCDTCPQNKYGSAAVGTGKACKNRYSLAVLPAGFYTPSAVGRGYDLQLFTDPKHYSRAEIAGLKLPVMSCKGFDEYRAAVRNMGIGHVMGVATRLFLTPDNVSQWRVNFELIEPLPNELIAPIYTRFLENSENMTRGYEPPQASRQR